MPTILESCWPYVIAIMTSRVEIRMLTGIQDDCVQMIPLANLHLTSLPAITRQSLAAVMTGAGAREIVAFLFFSPCPTHECEYSWT